MKSILVLLIVTVIAAGCKKRNIIGPEPLGWYVTKNDTLVSGRYWDIHIGDGREVVYYKLRALRQEKAIPALSLIDYYYNSLTPLKDNYPFIMEWG